MPERRSQTQCPPDPAPGPRRDGVAELAAAPRRLPGADQPAVVHARAARADRGDRARDPRRRHRADQARLPLGRPRAGPVPADRRRHRGRPPLARLLADLRPGPPGRPHPITVKNVDEGMVSPYLVRRGRPGTIVSLGGVEGDFVLPDPLPDKLLFISAGSGITPIMSMLRNLDQSGELDDAVLLHSARRTRGGDLRRRAARARAASRRLRAARAAHRATTGAWARPTSTSCARTGASARRSSPVPAEMLDAFNEHWERGRGCERLHMERFQPKLGLGEARRARAARSAS